jgi:hypothetical protein
VASSKETTTSNKHVTITIKGGSEDKMKYWDQILSGRIVIDTH